MAQQLQIRKPIIYSASTFAESALTRALAYGVGKAFCTPQFLNPNIDAGQIVKNCDLAVFLTYRQPTRRTIEAYEAAGVPTLITDLGYLRRPIAADGYRSGFWQLGRGRLNVIPALAPANDRLEALSLPRPFTHELDATAPVLVLGQVCPDAQHDLTVEAHNRFVVEVLAALAKLKVPAVYRPHPRSREPVPAENIFAVHPDAIIQAPSEDATLERALSGARAVVTWNSTAGLEALAMGVPVFCRRERSHYAEIAHDVTALAKVLTASRQMTPTRPKPDAVSAYLARVAYAQWTLAEIESGVALRFALDSGSAKHEHGFEIATSDALGRAPPTSSSQTVGASGANSAISKPSSPSTAAKPRRQRPKAKPGGRRSARRIAGNAPSASARKADPSALLAPMMASAPPAAAAATASAADTSEIGA